MGIREKINEHQPLVIGIAIGVIVLALIVITWQTQRSDAGGPGGRLLYYTTDDGATYFAAESRNLPPFMHDGKEAVRAYVFTCDDGKTKFVSHLERYPARVKQALERDLAAIDAGEMREAPAITGEHVEVKRPGEGKWHPIMSPEGLKIAMPTCPEGTGQPEPVLP